MKRLRVWDKEVEGEFGGCPGTYIRLINGSYGVNLVACDNKGVALSGGYLIHLLNNGIITFHCDISREIGFPLDGQRRLKVEGEAPETAMFSDFRHRETLERMMMGSMPAAVEIEDDIDDYEVPVDDFGESEAEEEGDEDA